MEVKKEMDRIKEISIMEAVLHVLDVNSDEPILNEYSLELTDEVYKFILKHTEKVLKDDELKYAVFNQYEGIIKNLCQGYLAGESNLINISKELARHLFYLMKNNASIPPCDLITVTISTEFGPMIGILKLDYIKNFAHKIDFVEECIHINLAANKGLPDKKKINKCAFIRPGREDNQYDLLVLDKGSRKSEEEYGANYFTENFLECSTIKNDRDETKTLLWAAEYFVRNNLVNDAAKAENVRKCLKDKLIDEEVVNIEDLSNELFPHEPVTQNDFKKMMESQNLNKVSVDKEFLDKKLKKIKLVVDKDIELSISNEAYKDRNRFEINENMDGSINITIKNVLNYLEK
jgi:hypothetical protein